jgi:penicillin-binding protein 1A
MSTEVVAVRDVAGGSGRYVADWVMDILPAFVGTVDKDIVVDTSIDLRMQASAARAVSEVLAADAGKHGVGEAALVAMDRSGAVKALVGGSDYSRAPFNRAVYARRRPGSAFKPFVYLTALERGLIPESVRVDQPVSIRGWSPENYSKEYRGPVTLQTALALSLNTVSAQLTAEVGPEAVAATARRLGINSPLMATPSIALGTSEVTLMELTGAIAPFANGGVGIAPHVIRRIATVDGEVLYERTDSSRGQVVDPMQVAMMNAMLTETLERGTGKRAAIAGWHAAGKTGTSQDFRDAWFIGYTAPLIAGAWFGNDDNKPTKKASGSNLPAITWQYFMSEALQGVAVAALPGDYRFRAPGNFAFGRSSNGLPRPVTARYGEDGQPLVLAPRPVAPPSGQLAELPPPPAGGWVDNPQIGPVPPGTVGPTGSVSPLGPRPRPRRQGFFQRLFGG